MYDRTTTRLVEKNALAYRLFTKPLTPPVRPAPPRNPGAPARSGEREAA